MRLKITKSKNYVHYSIISDYTTLNGKRTTKVFENLGNQSQVEERFGNVDTINEIRKYIHILNSEEKEEIIKKEFNPNKRISLGIKRRFNVGYLFLEKLYTQLNIKSICDLFKININFTLI